MSLATTFFSFIPVFLGLFFALVGGFFFISGLRGRGLERASRSWPSVPGKVSAATINVVTLNFRTKFGGKRTDYRPEIQYEYFVKGAPYHGSQITYGAINVDQASAEAMLAKYPAGSAVTVFYNPKKPAEAVLEHTDRGMSWFILVGGVVGLVGLCTGCFGVMLLSSVINAAK